MNAMQWSRGNPRVIYCTPFMSCNLQLLVDVSYEAVKVNDVGWKVVALFSMTI